MYRAYRSNRKRLTASSGITATALSAIAFFLPQGAVAQSELPLLLESNLVYEGAFKVPRGGDGNATFSYGGTAIAYNAASNTLYLVGHSSGQLSAEISIPEIVNSTNEDDLDTATVLQDFRDATEGRLDSINPTDSNDQRIGGQFIYDGKLYIGAFSYYDAEGTQLASHFVRPLNLSVNGQVVGPVAVGEDVHFTGGYMADIPAVWQDAFGGPALTGNCCKSIISNQSWGPAASVFDPSDIGQMDPVPATDLVYYDSDHELGPGATTQNPLFNLTSRVDGIVFPEDSRSILFFGHHGVGPYCYGDGGECGDPADDSKGTHAYPYKYQVWAYDALELLEVRNGNKQPYEARPYNVWTFQVPFETDNEHDTGGIAYDAARRRIFFVQSKFGVDRLPLIHVYYVNTGPRPAGPSNLIVE